MAKFAPQRKSQNKKLILGIIIVIIIAALLWVGFSNSASSISSPTTLTLSNNQSAYFKLPGSDNTYVIFLSSSSNSTSTFYITGTPVLVKPISSVTLGAASSANVSTDGSRIANVQIKLISTKTGSAQVQLTPLPSSLSIRPSGSVSLISSANGTAYQTTLATTSTQTTSIATTTASGSGTTTAASTSLATTTVQQIPTSSVLAVANSSQAGALMIKYDELYTQDQGCTPSAYNVTYQQYFHTAPSGPESYTNVSAVTPISISAVITSTGANLYNVSYDPILPTMVKAHYIVVIQVNMTSSTATKFTYDTGLNYTALDQQYSLQSSFTGLCGAYIE